MASPTTQTDSSGPQPKPQGRVIEYDRYIEGQLRATRTRVKVIDLASSALLLLASVLLFFLAAAVIDHWILSGGLSVGGRFIALAVLILGGGAYLGLRIAPLLFRRVNPVYAAHSIEKAQPGLKNSLVNFLMFRSHPGSLRPVVYEAVEEQAATKLATVPVEATVDYRPLIRLGWVLSVVVLAVALYTVLSPKSLWSTICRVMAPTSDREASTIANFSRVEPGTTRVFHGQSVEVSVDVAGLGSDDVVYLYYTTADQQVVERKLPMRPTAGSDRWTLQLPPEGEGLQQDVSYCIEARDKTSKWFHIEAVTAPAILVERVEYVYPQYTELAPRTVRQQGDLQALEGTEVTIFAEANQPIEAAWLDFERDGKRDLTMRMRGPQSGSVQFSLRLNREGTPEHTSYQLRFRNEQGTENLKPTEHRIEVTADRPPEIVLAGLPAESDEGIKLPLGSALSLQVEARDPDFKLAAVTLLAERKGRNLFDEALLTGKPTASFQGSWTLDTRRYPLEVGDEIVLWAEAQDNKQPQPNEASTPRYTLRIVEPQTPPDDRLAQAPRRDDPNQPQDAAQDQTAGEQQGQPREGPQKGEQPEQPQAGENPQGGDAAGEQPQGDQQQTGGNQSGEQQQQQRVDPEADPGKAIEKINEHFEEQQPKEQQQEPQQGENGQGEQNQQQQGSQEQQGEQQQQNQGEQQPGEQGGGGENAGSGGTSGQQQQNGAQQSQESTSGEGGQSGQQTEAPGDQQSTESGGAPNEMSRREPGTGDDADAPSERQTGEAQGEGRTEAADPQQQPSGDDATDAAGGEGGKSGEGAQSRGEGRPEEAPHDPGQAGEEQPTGGDSEDPKGEAGQGKSQDGGPTPSPQNDGKQRDKTASDQPSEDPQRGESDPKSPGVTPKESDSQGDTSGDRSGGGEDGGGQRANQQGTGAAGQNTAAEEGGGMSQEKGEGPTSGKGGDQQQAEQPTDGESSDQAGNGSRERQGKGDGQGDAADDGKGGDQPTDDSDSNSGGKRSPNRRSGGESSHEEPTASEEAVEPGGDDANLEYARNATDLALERLKDQLARDQVDEKLLEKLQWSRDDLERFVQRWEQMREAAAQQGAAGDQARERWDDALRNLGLRPPGTSLSGGAGVEQVDRLRESSRSTPPAEYADQYRAFSTGTSRAAE